jgi:hypothetical protein
MIEAARAGEYGEPFTVVARDVKACRAAGPIGHDIIRIIVAIQLQDHGRQGLDHVLDALAILDQALSERQGCTPNDQRAVPELDGSLGW